MSEQSRALSTPLAAAMSTLLAAGMVVAGWLVRIKLRLELDPDFQSSCNFGDKFNCDLVQTSDQSQVFGFPLALWGLVAYATLLFAVWMARRPVDLGRPWLASVLLIGVATCVHSAWLAWISSTVIGAWCLFCMAMYGVNLGVTGLALFALGRGRSLSELVTLGTRPRVLLGLALSAAVAAGAAVLLYGSVRSGMAEERIALARAQMAPQAALEPAPAAQPQGKQAEDPGSPQDPPASAAPAPQATASGGGSAPDGVLTHPDGFRYSQVVLRKGRSFYEVPVSASDFALGPADAPVTVVKFADFECGYCRVLSRNMKPLREKYGDKVRWVFKHFPLNNACNKVMKGAQHLSACDAAKAANCAGEQGRFWPLHDTLYAADLRLNPVNLRRWAEEAGVADMQAWDQCYNSERGHLKTHVDTEQGRFARISGTPRTYINGYLVPGVVATEVLDYYISAALAQAAQGAGGAGPSAVRPAQARDGMVQARTARGTFWIDAWEASLDAEGRALSVAGVRPAEVSWYEATEACKKAGKRLCTEEEWVSACTGAPAVDDNGNGDFTDDKVEGTLFPYGPFHEGGRCNDDAPGEGQARATGSMQRCVSPSGIFDQSGNLAEWTGADEASGWLTGTDFRWGAKATCMYRIRRFGLGYRNSTTGFRCCADEAVAAAGAPPVTYLTEAEPGTEAPDFSVPDAAGKPITKASLRGKVTIVSFFASWCGPCRKELPDLQTFYDTHKGSGLEVLAINVDKVADSGKSFVADLKLNYRIGYDDKAVTMGQFGVRGMPTAFVLDRKGRIADRIVGINAEKMAAFKAAALDLLKAK